jgi:molybdopterin molybdotransferase
VITFDQAIARLLPLARPLGQEEVALGAAAGRVLAEPVRAAISAPAADVSTMDGYAVSSADLRVLPVLLTVTGEALPGSRPGPALPPGCCVRIFTGAPLPAGCDRVVIQEDVQREGASVRIGGPLDDSRYIRAAGSDSEAGDELVPVGRLLGARFIVAAAAGDVAAVTVFRTPRVALLATGDELARPGEARLRPGAVPDSLSDGLAAFAAEWGARVVHRARVPDDLDLLRPTAAAALAAADLVVVTGGASVGERDFARQMFGDALDFVFAKVAMKPGKPVWLATAGGTILLGLPGNPTSALVTARLFLAPLLAGLGGRDLRSALTWRQAPLAEPLGPTGPRETFSRGRIEAGAVRLLPNQDSGAQRTLADADLLVRRRPDASGYAAGEMIEVLDF